MSVCFMGLCLTDTAVVGNRCGYCCFLLGSTHDNTVIAGIVPNSWIEWAVLGIKKMAIYVALVIVMTTIFRIYIRQSFLTFILLGYIWIKNIIPFYWCLLCVFMELF